MVVEKLCLRVCCEFKGFKTSGMQRNKWGNILTTTAMITVWTSPVLWCQLILLSTTHVFITAVDWQKPSSLIQSSFSLVESFLNINWAGDWIRQEVFGFHEENLEFLTGKWKQAVYVPNLACVAWIKHTKSVSTGLNVM